MDTTHDRDRIATQIHDGMKVEWTARQRQVLDLMARDKTNAEIADALGVTLAGAKWHVSEVLSKLGVSSREEAKAYWLDQRSVHGRATRMLRGLAGVAALKWGAPALVAAALTGAAAFVAVPLLSGGAEERPAEAEPPALFLGSLFDEPRAESVAVAFADELLRAYAVGTANPQRDATGALVPGSAALTKRYTGADVRVTGTSFVKSAPAAETAIEGVTLPLPASTDVWTVRLAFHDPANLDLDAKPDILVSFEDGTGRVLTGGFVMEAAYYASAVAGRYELASATDGWVKMTLFVSRFDPARIGGSAAVLDRLAGSWCLMEHDSRSPAGMGGGCGTDPKALNPVTNPMLLGGVSEHNGYAHANGLVADNVAAIRLKTEDGRTLLVEPGPRIEDPEFTARGFIAIAPGSSWFVSVEALDASGAVVASKDFSNHPSNPPMP